MNVAIVKYNAGNIYSVVNALKRLGVNPLLTDSKEELCSADRVLFPGQGEAGNCMKYLKERGLDSVIRDLRQPVLGICVGQQLLCRHSEEGDTDCIGVFDVDVKKFKPTCHAEKVPAMGWNRLGNLKSGLFSGFTDNEYVYFVHSYFVAPVDDTLTAATTSYGLPITCAVARDNVFATQFHVPFFTAVASGTAAMFATQTILNVAMCLYAAPVVGVTLPFFSYGGSSMWALFDAMGVVSGIKERSRPGWLIN